MFMRNNRALNGAPQPEDVARADAAAQRAQDVLDPSPSEMGNPQSRTFPAELSTIEEINRRHYRGGLDEGEWPGNYESHIPVGPSL